MTFVYKSIYHKWPIGCDEAFEFENVLYSSGMYDEMMPIPYFRNKQQHSAYAMHIFQIMRCVLKIFK